MSLPFQFQLFVYFIIKGEGQIFLRKSRNYAMRCSQNRKTLPKQNFTFFFRVRVIYIVVGTRTTFNCSKSKNKHISITGNFYLFSMISFKYCNFLAEVSHHQKLCPVTPKQCQEVTSPLSEKYLPLGKIYFHSVLKIHLGQQLCSC